MVVSLNLHILCILLSYSLLINAQIVEIPVANLSTWINSPLDSPNNSNWDGLRTVLLRESFGPRFVYGFLCQFRNDTCFFTVSIFQTRTGVNPPFIESLEAVWTAKRNTPVKINATLQLSQEGDLILRDADGTYSFDHPTDSLLPGQRMVSGQKLIATESAWNLTEGACGYPFVCGNYGICSNGQCSCPGADDTTNLFRQVDGRQPNLGCTAITPISCNSSESQSFLEVMDLYYFSYRFSIDINNTDMETCKQACLKNCSGKLALFQYKSNASSGDCVLLSDVFSTINNEQMYYYYNTSALFKVQNTTQDSSTISPKNRTNQLAIIMGSTLGAVFGVSLTVGIFFFLRFTKDYKEIEEDYLDQLLGMPTRYSYEDLKSATNNFSSKLGEGGFGAVFQVTLPSGIKVAVKCLTGFGQEKNSFFAEVESIGSIHHVHLYAVGKKTWTCLSQRRICTYYLFKIKAEEGQLLDMVDKSSEDMQLYGAEVVNMLRVTAWCLQSHFIRRPSMSVVVKVLEGVMHVEDNLDYNFSSPPALREKTATVHNEGAVEAATPLLPEELSGPRCKGVL
nr:g-type lectin s-receptor-like serine/threonine-protein kinase sd2-5 [Quercus suber]